MKDFTTGSESKHIFKFAVPMLIGNVFQQLYNIVDSIIVGRYLGDKALAAVGASFPIIFMIIALIIGVGIGVSVVISQYYGAKQYDKVKRASDTAYIFLLVAGGIMTIVGLVTSEWIFKLLQLPDELVKPAVTYLNIYMAGLVIMFGFNGTASILRGIGDSKTPLYFLVFSTFANIGLDILFIVVLNWGIAGAAWATVISQAGAFIAAILYLNHKQHILRINLKNITFDWEIFRQSIRIGLPAGIHQTLVAVGGMAMMGIVNTFGTPVIAAYSAAGRIDSLAVIPIMNFSAALSGFVGQNIGAGKIERIAKGLKAATWMSAVVCIAVTAVIIIWGRSIMTIFTTSPDVIEHGYQYLTIVSVFYIVFAVMFNINGLLRGAGAAVIPMYITLLSLWIIRVPLAYFLSKTLGLGEKGVWWAIPIGWIFGAIAAVIYYKYGKWQHHSVVNPTLIEGEEAIVES
ncbi:MAG: MATE family efflux transporter [Bacteroidales bacterium]|nr:MATE family efflux transporter [Bacteroidales bacterium]